MKNIIAKKIQADKLDTDIKYRIDFVSSLIEFTEKDHERILNAKELILPFLDVISDVVYERMFAYDITKVNFTTQMEGYKGQVEKDLNSLKVTDSIIVFRKTMLVKYLRRLVNAEWNIAFLKYINWVGEIHSNTALKKNSNNVEFIHMNVMMGFIATSIMDIISNASDGIWDETTRAETISAFTKFFWLQNDLFVKYHISKEKLAKSKKKLTNTEADIAKKYVKGDFYALSLGGALTGLGFSYLITTLILSMARSNP